MANIASIERHKRDKLIVMLLLVTISFLGSNATYEYCRDGHEGPYCDVCSEGYSKDVLGICQSCEDSTKAVNVVVTLMMLLLIVVIVLFIKNMMIYKRYKRQFRGLKASGRILFVSYQIIAVLPR